MHVYMEWYTYCAWMYAWYSIHIKTYVKHVMYVWYGTRIKKMYNVLMMGTHKWMICSAYQCMNLWERAYKNTWNMKYEYMHDMLCIFNYMYWLHTHSTTCFRTVDYSYAVRVKERKLENWLLTWKSPLE